MCGPLSTRIHHAFCHHGMCLRIPFALSSLLHLRALSGPQLLFLLFAPPEPLLLLAPSALLLFSRFLRSLLLSRLLRSLLFLSRLLHSLLLLRLLHSPLFLFLPFVFAFFSALNPVVSHSSSALLAQFLALFLLFSLFFLLFLRRPHSQVPAHLIPLVSLFSSWRCS